MAIVETKKRTVFKTVSWRLIATINSFLILVIDITDVPILNAIYMNITGMILFYVFERVWTNINYGRYLK